MNPTADVTRLLQDWREGDEASFEKLLPLVYDELKVLARSYMRRERHGHTLQTTALVHEAYLRLVDQNRAGWRDRAHFFAAAARIMRHILVDHARRHRLRERDGEARLSPEKDGVLSHERAAELLTLNDALDALADLDERQARIVEVRYFGGLTIDETAVALDISAATVKREWSVARAWLYRRLTSSTSRGGERLGNGPLRFT